MDHREYLSSRLSARTEQERAALFEKAKLMENEDRECFSRHRDGWEVVGREDLSRHPHASLVPLYEANTGKCPQTAFAIDQPSPDDANRAKRAFFLNRKDREQLAGQLSVVPTLSEFKSTFLDVFCEGQLRYLNWNNVFAAGGGVLACAQPIPAEHAVNMTTKRQYFHDLQYSSSDVDLFLYGLNEEEGKAKLVEIYRAVCESNPHTVVCFRSAHAVTLVSQYPFRHIQIVLRLYASPYEVLAGFDVDACTVGFDGQMVYADVRAHHALVTRRNTIDVTRRSPSYEMRLAKYGVRGFEVEIKDLKRDVVDPGIFERPWNSLDGLAKLLVLERLRTPEQRSHFFEMQKLNRGGFATGSRGRPHYDSATQERLEEKLGGTAEVSNYSTVFLPWGREHDAERTMRLMAKKDMKLNNSWFMRERSYRLHPCFFGTAEEILQDCSKDDPPFPPKKEGEDAKMREHRETYVRGPLTFIADDPGRQRIGSFHPLSEVGWAEGVYFHDSTEELFSATNADDPKRVQSALEFCKSGPDCRDFFGRTALHLALMAGCLKAAKVLLEAGASPLEPMAGGRTVFHLAAIYNHDEMVSILRDYAEKTMLKKLEEAPQDPSATDGATAAPEGSSSTESKMAKKAKAAVKKTIRALDGDGKVSALQMALVLGNLKTARALLQAGASVIPSVDEDSPEEAASASRTVSLLSDKYLKDGIKLLLEFGFSCSTRETTGNCQTVFASLVVDGNDLAVELLLEHDKTAIKALSMLDGNLTYPLEIAIAHGHARIVEMLINTKKTPFTITEDMIQDARIAFPVNWRIKNFTQSPPILFKTICEFASAASNHITTWTCETENSRFQQPLKAFLDAKADAEDNHMNLRYNLLKKSHIVSTPIEDVVKLCIAVLKAAPASLLSQSYTEVLGDWQLSSALGHQDRLSDEYWVQKKKYDRSSGNPLAVSPAEFAALYVGRLQNMLDRWEKPDEKVFNKPSLFAAAQELEAQLRSHPQLQSVVRGWRMHQELTDMALKQDIFSGLREDLQRSTQELQKERLDYVRSVLDEFAKVAKCPKDILEWTRNSGVAVANQFRQRGSRAVVNDASAPFPKTSDLFFTNNDVEKEVRNFLIANEQRYPVPLPLPEDYTKRAPEPWLIAGLQRALFKMCARTFLPLTTVNDPYADTQLEHRRTKPSGATTGYPKGVQEQCSLVFAQCRKGVVEGLETLCTTGNVPMATCDLEGFTCLTMGILARSPDVIREVVRICDKQFIRPMAKGKGKQSERIDNFELMEEDDDDDDEEDEEEEEDADEEGDDDEDEDNDNKRKKHLEEQQKPGGSTIKPESLFLLTCALYLDSSPILAHAKQTREALVQLFGAAFMSSMRGLHLRVTPLQLAIILGDISVVRTLLDLAHSISPKLVCSLMQHSLVGFERAYVPETFNTWDLVIGLDRQDMLQMLIPYAGYALKFYELSALLGADPWKLELEGAVENTTSKKKKGEKTKYEGLQSSLFGETKRKNEMKRDPRLSRMDRLPNPNKTLMHVAAQVGSTECFKMLSDESRLIPLVVELLERIPSIRTLLANVRERTPKAFTELYGNDVTLQTDARIITRFMLGGSDVIQDRSNSMPIHYAVRAQTLEKLVNEGGVKLFSAQCLSRTYTSVALEDKIRFPPSTLTSLGEFTPGGSPLSLACFLGLTDMAELLMDKFGMDPNQSDAYFYGMNAFHLALHQKHFACAKVVAAKMQANKLMEPNAIGITPLMTAASTGSVQGLLACMAACPQAKSSQATASSMAKDGDGQLALHFAANARFAETLKRIMDWTAEQAPKSEWLSEEFASGRTPFDVAINAVLANETNFGAERVKRLKAAKLDRLLDEELSEEHLAEARLTDRGENGREIVDVMRKHVAGKTRTRASFQQVRPAREKRLDAIASVETSGDLSKAQEDLTAVWGENSNGTNFTQKSPVTVMDALVGDPYAPIASVWQ